MAVQIEAVRGDITRLKVDAIVNAANEWMLGGGGVDGAIHHAAGPRLLEVCRALPEVRPGVRCPTGEARLTSGFDLPAKFVIHTVGPVWRGGAHGEADLLANCYRNSLKLATENRIQSIAFPAISTGAYGYPLKLATSIAVQEIYAFLLQSQNNSALRRAIFVCFDNATLREYSDAITAVKNT